MTHGIGPTMQLVIPACSALAISLVFAAVWPRWWRPIAVIVGCAFPACMMAFAAINDSNIWFVVGGIWAVVTLPPAYLGARAGEMVGRRWGRMASPIAPGLAAAPPTGKPYGGGAFAK